MSEIKTTEISINVSDPLVLHYSNHLGMILVSKPFEGYNYNQWSRTIHINLSAKNEIEFINGSIIAQPSTNPRFNMWR